MIPHRKYMTLFIIFSLFISINFIPSIGGNKFSFSNTIIGEETGAKLKEINFGNQQFYVISKSDVIFAFLVEDMNSLLQRYMYLIADEFIYDFSDYLKCFNGDITPFASFEEKINQYFII